MGVAELVTHLTSIQGSSRQKDVWQHLGHLSDGGEEDDVVKPSRDSATLLFIYVYVLISEKIFDQKIFDQRDFILHYNFTLKYRRTRKDLCCCMVFRVFIRLDPTITGLFEQKHKKY